MISKNEGLGVLVVAAVAALMFAAVVAGPAMAARGGNGNGNASGHGKGKAQAFSVESAVTLSVSPDPPPPAYSGEMYMINGTGFTPGAAVKFELGSSAQFGSADENGFASSPFQAWAPGTFDFVVYELNGSWVQVGSITVEIVEQ